MPVLMSLNNLYNYDVNGYNLMDIYFSRRSKTIFIIVFCHRKTTISTFFLEFSFFPSWYFLRLRFLQWNNWLYIILYIKILICIAKILSGEKKVLLIKNVTGSDTVNTVIVAKILLPSLIIVPYLQNNILNLFLSGFYYYLDDISLYVCSLFN